jgi:DNA invertase Pin-like site-specific DNA recombinase
LLRLKGPCCSTESHVCRDRQVAVAYIRVSKDEQCLGTDAQRATIRAWAARESFQIATWHIDRGVCSVTPVENRPALRAALASVRESGAGMLVVAKRDRIARDVVLAAGIERAAKSMGARLISADGSGNGDTPADGFMRTIVDGAAEYERALIRSRTRAALEAKRAKGERIGAITYGFAVAADGVHLVAVEHEQRAISRARRLAGNGRSLRSIAAALAHAGYVSRSGRPFHPTQIARMLAGPRPQKVIPPTCRWDTTSSVRDTPPSRKHPESQGGAVARITLSMPAPWPPSRRHTSPGVQRKASSIS